MEIFIDGAQGEGGGQILRSSLALSMLTGKPFRIGNIRANRDKPGLLRQHLTAVRAAMQISGAKAEGADLGSRSLSFAPGKIRGGEYRFCVGSAGSTTLVLQAVLPALLTADDPSQLVLEGGTHNPFAPPFDFLDRVFFPLIKRMGPELTTRFERAGFYPAGGGRYEVAITPVRELRPIELRERGEIRARRCTSVIAGLPQDIADRELELVGKMMGWTADAFQTRRLPNEEGPGNLLEIEIESEHVTELFTAFGMRGVRAEAVADDVLQQTKRYLSANVPVGKCLADQLILPFAMAGAGSFITQELTRHATTNIDIVQKFLPVKIEAEKLGRDRILLKVGA